MKFSKLKKSLKKSRLSKSKKQKPKPMDIQYTNNLDLSILSSSSDSSDLSDSLKSLDSLDSSILSKKMDRTISGSILPKKLAIYFGTPSKVNGSTTIQQAVNIFKLYDIVIFGSGLEASSHPDHNNTQLIINNPGTINTKFFGFIDSTQDLPPVQTIINKLSNMGMDGVYFNSFDYGAHVDRSKQNELIDYTHTKSMMVMCSAQNPDDIFSSQLNPTYNPDGIQSTILINDWYLFQGYQIVNGAYQAKIAWKNISQKMDYYKNLLGINVATITTYNNLPFDQGKADYSYYSTILWNFNGWGWGEQNFSYATNLLPLRMRKELDGNKFVTTIQENNDIFERHLNVGIKIDTVNHIVTNLTH